MFHFFFEKALFSSIADGHNVRSARKPSRSRISLSFWWKDGCLVHTLLLKYLHVMTAAHHSIQKSTATPSIFIFKDSLFGWHIKRWNCFCMSDRTVFYQQRECYVSVRSNTSPLLIRLFLFKKDSQFGRLSSLHIAPPADARRRRRRRNQRGNKTVLRVLPNPYGIIIPVEVPPQCVLRIFPFLKKKKHKGRRHDIEIFSFILLQLDPISGEMLASGWGILCQPFCVQPFFSCSVSL